ncbi:DUF3558 domain-containing protein [Actinophytocola xanthii]|uniref:DUF3558 domain-containing protein n=1 Tax=Actinophytocola xanthii TaxID=1912961 RepID=A0A1Q8CK56_9PSEU|nr:DUF3558 domain-containing protein [Actinophytocola xanthii]OLF14740.1 hypothetical protein BU204_25350 [Actinophytocola xanthii]
MGRFDFGTASMLGLVVAGWVAVAGCGSDSGDSPAGESVTSPLSTSVEVPPVARPLDVGTFVGDPCALLDEFQRRELGLPRTQAREATCDLRADGETADSSTYLRLVIFEDVGLTGQYAQCGTVDCSQWSVDQVDGYPVIRAPDEMIAEYGSCKIFLGVADDASVAVIDVVVDPSAGGPDCERADRVAGMVLATLR